MCTGKFSRGFLRKGDVYGVYGRIWECKGEMYTAECSSEKFSEGKFSAVEFDEGEFSVGKLFGHRNINYHCCIQNFLGIPVHISTAYLSATERPPVWFRMLPENFLELRVSRVA